MVSERRCLQPDLPGNVSGAPEPAHDLTMAELWTQISSFAESSLGITPFVSARIGWTVLAVAVYVLVRYVVLFTISKGISELGRRYVYTKTVSYILAVTTFVSIVAIWLGSGSGLVAYIGILSAGVAITMRDPLINFAGWMFIMLRKPFVVGDRIQIGEHRGDVIDTRIFQFTMAEIGNWVDSDQSTGRIIHIPNGWVFNHSTANYSQGFDFIWNELPITVTFESNWEKAKKILTAVVKEHSRVPTHQAEAEVHKAARRFMIYYQHLTPIVWTSVAESGVILTVRYICKPRARRSSETKIWEDVLRNFGDADDIDFAYPTTRFYNNVSEGKHGASAPQLAPTHHD